MNFSNISDLPETKADISGGRMKKIIEKTVEWLANTHLLSFPRRRMAGIINHAISSKNGVIFFYHSPQNAKTFDLIKQIKNENEMLLSDLEAYQLFLAVRRTEKIPGDIAEVGVYKGGSAKLICETRGKRTVHLFDSFEGLPNLSDNDDKKQFHKGDYYALFENVKDYLIKYRRIHIYKGLFPSSAKPIKNKGFSFVHLDVDIYESTVACLKFFYPRLNPGGTIISHDYPDSKGVKKAFDEFFSNKPETIINLPACNQCLVIKT